MFLYPALAAGFAFLVIPPLVHLINLLRHRRRRWAAMDFLLASYRKQKKWVRLRQILLLLSRIAIAGLLAALLAGWTGTGGIADLVGAATTHHVVIVDDSYSMSSRTAGSTAYDNAKKVVSNLVKRTGSEDGVHQLTLIRASRAQLTTSGEATTADAAADLVVQTVEGDGNIVAKFQATTASALPVEIDDALTMAAELIQRTPADSTELVIASDFRESSWSAPDSVATVLQSLPSSTKIRFVDCADASGRTTRAVESNNLAITRLFPRPDVWVAGVPAVMNATIRNYGSIVAENVELTIRVRTYGKSIEQVDPDRVSSGEVQTLPSPVIKSIAPGEEITKTFQVFIPTEGTHAVEVSLPEDALLEDNRRFSTLPLSPAGRVLVVDDEPNSTAAFFISTVLDPGSQVQIGAVPETKPLAFLRDATLSDLAVYRAIYVIDPNAIGPATAETLAQFVRRGGGLAWFFGDRASPRSLNDSLFSGSSKRRLLPAMLDSIDPLAANSDGAGDIQISDTRSTITTPLRRAGDAVLSSVALTRSWTLLPADDSIGNTDTFDEDETNQSGGTDQSFRTLIQGNDQRPLVTEHVLGEGKVITFLTDLDSGWTNWPGDPTFVVLLLQANAALWTPTLPETQRYVDAKIDLTDWWQTAESEEPPRYFPPSEDPPRAAIELKLPDPKNNAANSAANDATTTFAIDPVEAIIEADPAADDFLRPGLAEVALLDRNGKLQVYPLAGTIRIGDNDLSRINSAEVISAMLPTKIEWTTSTADEQSDTPTVSSVLTLWLFGILAMILALEQTLASWASYHSRPVAA